MNYLPLGAVVCDVGRRFVQANHAGHQFLARSEGLKVVDGAVLVGHRSDSHNFEAAVAGSTAQGTYGEDLRRLLLRGTRPNRLIQASIVALPQLVTLADGNGAAAPQPSAPLLIIFLRRLGRSKAISPVAVSRLFNFTTAEAKVIAALCRGLSVAEYATANDLSRHTVRNQVKAALSKSGTRRQAELVRIVLSSLFGSDL
jgi:DNA-binding CsgD family transcriptional regulator